MGNSMHSFSLISKGCVVYFVLRKAAKETLRFYININF
jgi:hypothetical protein